MGLDKFNVAPDNKGGRKKGGTHRSSNASKDEDSFGTRPIHLEYETNPLTQSNDSEDYWQAVYDKFTSSGDPTTEEISQMAGYTQTRPDSVRLKLAEYGVWEAEDIEDLQFNPDPSVSSLLGGSSSGSSSSSSSPDTSSGLSSIIDNAK